MAKMFFTFKWGKSIFITEQDLKTELLKYYTKTEVDTILKQYVTNVDLSGVLSDYVTNSDLSSQLNNYVLKSVYDQFYNQTQSDLQELGNNVNDNSRRLTTVETDITGVESVVGTLGKTVNTNTTNIEDNTNHINNIVSQLKNANFVYIDGSNLEWSNQINYSVGAIVEYNNILYLSKKDNNLNHAVTDTSWWVPFGEHSVVVDLSNYYTKPEITSLLNKYRTLDNTLYSQPLAVSSGTYVFQLDNAGTGFVNVGIDGSNNVIFGSGQRRNGNNLKVGGVKNGVYQAVNLVKDDDNYIKLYKLNLTKTNLTWVFTQENYGWCYGLKVGGVSIPQNVNVLSATINWQDNVPNNVKFRVFCNAWIEEGAMYVALEYPKTGGTDEFNALMNQWIKNINILMG